MATVAGLGSSWNVTNGVLIGIQGVGELAVQAGGSVTSDLGFIGFANGSSGAATVADSLRPFLQLTPKQRSTVILRDVLGYSASQVADMTGSSVASGWPACSACR